MPSAKKHQCEYKYKAEDAEKWLKAHPDKPDSHKVGTQCLNGSVEYPKGSGLYAIEFPKGSGIKTAGLCASHLKKFMTCPRRCQQGYDTKKKKLRGAQSRVRICAGNIMQ